MTPLPNQQLPVILEVWLDKLIAAENNTDRQACSLNYQLKTAKFSHHLDFFSFDLAECTSPKAQVEQLASANFMDKAHNVLLIGRTGAISKC
jgi:hypothetical protein